MENEETLAEAAAKYAEKELQEWTSKIGNFYGFSSSFIAGAKYQAERMYSDLEVYDILIKHTEDLLAGKRIMLNEWFETIKKK
jgi:hypothetical protein